MSNKDVFDSKDKLRWYHWVGHLGYYLPHWVRLFFSKPFKEPKKDLNILEKVQALLDSEQTDENIGKCKELTLLHRVVENTRARRRLEKWSLRVIVVYLLVILTIVFLTYTNIDFFTENRLKLIIPDPIMITILSTTTVNIIGLGLIVLRGHFLANDKANNMEEEKSKE